MSYLTLNLPLPPSTNNLFFNRPYKGRTKTTAYKAWLDEAGWSIKAQRPIQIHGEVKVDALVKRPNKASDLDNRTKALLDALVKFQVIDDDKHVIELRMRWGEVDGARVTISSADLGGIHISEVP